MVEDKHLAVLDFLSPDVPTSDAKHDGMFARHEDVVDLGPAPCLRLSSGRLPQVLLAFVVAGERASPGDVQDRVVRVEREEALDISLVQCLGRLPDRLLDRLCDLVTSPCVSPDCRQAVKGDGGLPLPRSYYSPRSL